MKLIPKSQLIKYLEREKVYSDSEDAIKLFLTSLPYDIDTIIRQLEKLTQVKGNSSIYELFESEKDTAVKKEKIGKAHYWLGFIYSNKYHNKFNFSLAIKHYLLATANGYDCTFKLGYLYYNGGADRLDEIDHANANHENAIQYFYKNLKNNRLESSAYIGLILRSGTVKYKNLFFYRHLVADDIKSTSTSDPNLLKESMKYLLIGSNVNWHAKYYCGVMHYLSQGCNQDFKIAAKFMEDSIFKYFNDDIIYLADMYFNGKGVEVNYSKSLTFSLIASQFDRTLVIPIQDIESKLDKSQLASAYFEATNYHVGNELYIKYLIKAKDFESVEAMEVLIYHYQNGFTDLIECDLSMAYDLAVKASNLKSANATNSLALMYEDGKGVISDINEAIRLYKLASDYGSADASQYMLSIQPSLAILRYLAISSTLSNIIKKSES